MIELHFLVSCLQENEATLFDVNFEIIIISKAKVCFVLQCFSTLWYLSAGLLRGTTSAKTLLQTLMINHTVSQRLRNHALFTASWLQNTWKLFWVQIPPKKIFFVSLSSLFFLSFFLFCKTEWTKDSTAWQSRLLISRSSARLGSWLVGRGSAGASMGVDWVVEWHRKRGGEQSRCFIQAVNFAHTVGNEKQFCGVNQVKRITQMKTHRNGFSLHHPRRTESLEIWSCLLVSILS